METLPLQDIITAHTDSLATHAQEFAPMIRLLLLMAEGPVTPEQLASTMQWTPLEMEAFLRSSGLIIDSLGHIQLVAGAGCALDSLLVPMLTGRSHQVVSTCPATGKQIRLTATAQGVENLDPSGAVLSLRLPGAMTTASDVGATICAYGHFFVDRKHASAWPGLHPEAVLLSIEDAVHLAREIANAAQICRKNGTLN